MNIDLRHLPSAERRILERAMHITRPASEHKVFVCGTFLTGERNARWVRWARRHPAWANGTLHDTGRGYPAFEKGGTGRVWGELLTVDDEGLAAMDRVLRYPTLHLRERIAAFPTVGGRFPAWVYVLRELPKDTKPITSGKWRLRGNG